MSAKIGAAAVALAITVTWTPNVVFGGVSNLSQERTVSASIESPPLVSHRSDKTGKFEQSAEAHFMNELLDHDDVITSQTSTIGGHFVSASGSFVAVSEGELITFSNTIDASFVVTAPTDYHLAFRFAFVDRIPGVAGDFISLKLRNARSPSPVISKVYGLQDLDAPVKLDASGPLAPGEYELRFALQDMLAQRYEEGNYDLQFSINAGTHAVPLPPAAWTGLLTLAGLAGAMAYAGRRSRGDTGAALAVERDASSFAGPSCGEGRTRLGCNAHSW